MNTQRFTLALGAAGGGMLAAAFLPLAIAHAEGDAAAAVAPTDTFTYVLSGPEQITSISGIAPLDQQSSGYQLLDINDTTLGTATTPVTVGTVTTLENSTYFDGGYTNAESLVTGSTLAAGVTAADLPKNLPPADGTITDTFQYQALPSLFSNTYTEIPGVGSAAPTATDTLTLFGITFPAVQENFLASYAFPNVDTTFGPFATDVASSVDALLTTLGVSGTEAATLSTDIAGLF